MSSMHFKFFSYLVYVLFFTKVSVADSIVTTTVNASGSVRYFHEEKHPTKMDWGKWTFCSGALTKTEEFRSNSQEFQSDQNEGESQMFADVHGPLGKILANNLSWKSAFKEESSTFHINIRRQISSNSSAQDSSVCVTDDWKYVVDHATTTVHTSVKLTVPNGIWVMRIKSIGNGVKTKVTKVREVPIYTTSPVNENNSGVPLNGYQYFFTQPNEKFEITSTFSDAQARDLDIVASYEIHFISDTRCDELLKDSLGSSDVAQIRNFSQAVKNRLQSYENEISQGSEQVGIESLSQSTLFMGCLMNPKVTKKILYYDNILQMKELVSVIENFRINIGNIIAKKPYLKSYLDIGDTITLMSQAKLTSNVIAHLKPYCTPVPVWDLTTKEQIGSIPTYRRLSSNFNKALALLGPEGYGPYFKKVYPILRKIMDGRTYAEIKNNPELMSKMKEFDQMLGDLDKLQNMQMVSKYLERLGNFQPTEDLVSITYLVYDLERLISILQGTINFRFMFVGLGYDTKVSFDKIDYYLESTDQKMRQLIQRIKNVQKIVALDENQEVAGKFLNAIEFLGFDIHKTRVENLNSIYMQYLKTFTSGLDQTKELEGLKKCLTTQQ